MIMSIEGGVTAPKGYAAAGVACGIKKSGSPDLAIVASKPAAKACCVFTTNTVKAAPVIVSMENCKAKKIGAVVINSGNANACTGEAGLADAWEMCEITKAALNLEQESVLVASTGIIGEPLSMDKVAAGIKKAAKALSPKGGRQAAEAIMTTDTAPKEAAVEIPVGRKVVRIGGMAKGSGMIAPNMATMIAVITTDADICSKALRAAVKDAVDLSFNCITIDGDMSTNDTVKVLANGAAGNTHILQSSKGFEAFKEGLALVMSDLAEMMVRDGEAATKFIKVTAKGASCYGDAKAVAVSVAESILVKCAFFGEDANWGRIAAAAGASPAEFDPGKLSIRINGHTIMDAAGGAVADRKAVDAAVKEKDIEIIVDLKAGPAFATVLTTDLSVGFVKFNAHYRT